MSAPSRDAAAAAPRILQLLRTLDPESGGLVTYVEAARQATMGWDPPFAVAAVCTGDAPAMSAANRPPARSGPWAVLRLARWLWANVGRYDGVHIHGVFSWPLLLGSLVARLRGVPYVVSTHGHLYAWSLAQKRGRKRLHLKLLGRSLLCNAAALIATTDVEAQRLRELLPQAAVRVVPPGVAMPAVAERNHAGGVLRILFVGRIARQKGLPVLVDALAQVRQSGIDARLEIAGSGAAAETAQLRARIHELGLERAVDFRGFLNSVERSAALAAADVFALPSYMENFSFATAEALAAGVPVVVSEAVALASLVAARGCGEVVPVADHAALATALVRLADPARRVEAARRARACAQDELSLDRMGRSLRELYVSLRGAR